MVNKSPKAAQRSAPTRASGQGPRMGALDRFFEITHRGSTIPREIRGGIVTFVTMAYIIALNPLILGGATDGAGHLLGGLPYLGSDGAVIQANVDQAVTLVAAGTALIAGVMTIAMGIIGRFPIGLAAGLGLNAIVAFTVAPRMTWPEAMGLIVLEGAVILILVLSGFRQAVFKAVPRSLRSAIAVGIGLFITLVGLVDAGIVRRPASPTGPPVELGVNGVLAGWPAAVFVFGLIVVIVLHALKVRGAILISIVASTIAAVIIQAVGQVGAKTADHPTGWAQNIPALHGVVDIPQLDLFGQVSLFGAFAHAGQANSNGTVNFGVLGLILLVFALMLSDFFDTMGTIVAVGQEGNLLDAKGNPPHVTGILAVDAAAAMAGGFGSVSSNTSYIESASGVGDGARTGLASVVTGVLFLLATFFAPIVNVVPSEAAAPALVFVGFLMMGQARYIDWADIEEGLPAFLTVVLMPFTYSITVGIGAGFILWIVLKVVRRRASAVHWLLWVIGAAFLIYFFQGLLQLWFH